VSRRIIVYYNDLVFSPSESFLHKDFGQLGYVLAERYGADLEYWIAARNLNRGFTEFRGKRVRQFGKSRFPTSPRLDFLCNRELLTAIARDFAPSHFLIFPFTPTTDLRVARAVRKRSPATRIILKLDTNREFLEAIGRDWQRNRVGLVRRLRQSSYYRALLDEADLLICETSECEQVLRDGFLGLDLSAKLVKTYSGLSSAWLDSIGVTAEPAEERRNAIIVSGRISSVQKNSKLIFETGGLEGWTIEFVGAVDDALRAEIETQRSRNPTFDARFRFHGAVTDKQAYFRLLKGARALLMNSIGGEGFPNVFAEAHFCDLFIVASDVSGAADATDNGRWGMIYPKNDVAGLRAALHALPARLSVAGDDPEKDVYRQRFIWEHSLDQPAIRALFERSSG
jgi:glycosyltransferase involved in cell wall biosynthesis